MPEPNRWRHGNLNQLLTEAAQSRGDAGSASDCGRTEPGDARHLLQRPRRPRLPRLAPAQAGRRAAAQRDRPRGIDAGFDRRDPDSPWCGFAPLSARHVRQPAPTPDAVLRVALFTTAEGARRLALGRRQDGTYQLADEHGTTVRQSPDLASLLADLSQPEPAH